MRLKFAADEEIITPITLMQKLNMYNGQEVQIAINGKISPVTFLTSSATGENASDELTLEVIWGVQAPEFQNIYNKLRSAINKHIRVRVGKFEFIAKLADTTKMPANASFDDVIDARFQLIFNEVGEANTLTAALAAGLNSPIAPPGTFDRVRNRLAKAHTSSIVEILVPPNIWKEMKAHVPHVEDLEDPPHITLCYMPTLTKEQAETIKVVLKNLTIKFFQPLIKVTGAARFTSDTDKIPHYAAIDSPALMTFRNTLVDAIEMAVPGVIDLNTHPTYTPHICVQYVDRDEPLPFIQKTAWSASFVSFSFKGTDKTVYPFAAANLLHHEPIDEELEPGTELDEDLLKTAAEEDDDFDVEPETDAELSEDVDNTVAELKAQIKDILAKFEGLTDEDEETAALQIIELLSEDEV